MSGISNYKNNLKEFVKTIEHSFLEKLVFHEDQAPTFNKSSLPFVFRYCFCTMLVTNRGNFLLHTSLSDEGYETFWLDGVKSIDKITSELYINATVKKVIAECKYDLPFKLTLVLGDRQVIFYAAEIYDHLEKGHFIKMNDEMILVFDDAIEANKFEASITYAIS